jgi:hypothetical protein
MAALFMQPTPETPVRLRLASGDGGDTGEGERIASSYMQENNIPQDA